MESPAPFCRPDRITTLEDAEGRSRSLEIGPYGKVNKVTDEVGLVTTWERDHDGNPLRIVRPTGQAFSMTYDNEKNMLTRTDEVLGGTTTYTYEPVHGRVKTRTDALGHLTQFEYDPSGNRKKVISPLLRELNMTYYPDGNIETITDSLSRVTRYHYDADGNLETVTVTAGSESRVTSFVNFSSGYPETITNPLPEQLTLVRDQWNRPTSLTDHAGQTTGLTYDADGNLETFTPPSQPPHTFIYDERDWNTAYVPPELLGQDLRTTRVRNSEEQLKLETLADARSISYAYDSAGRLETTTIERGTYRNVYDGTKGQVSQVTEPGGSSLRFRYQGAVLTSARSADGGGVTYAHDSLGRISRLRIVDQQDVSCDTSAVLASWQADGNLIDATGNYNGTAINGDIDFVDGIDGQAFSFDHNSGSNNARSIMATVPLAGLNSATLATWVRTSQLARFSGTDYMMAVRNINAGTSFHIGVKEDKLVGRVCCPNASSGNVEATVDYDDAQWHHAALTRDPTMTRLYFDGQEVANAPIGPAGFLETDDEEVNIGARFINRFGFTGDLDGPTIYNRALTVDEVAQLYDGGETLLCAPDVLGEVAYAYDPDGAVEQAHDVTMTYDPVTGLLETVSLADLTKTLTYHDFGELFTESTEVNSTQTVRHEASYMPDSLSRVSQKTETIEGVTVTHDYRYDGAGRLEEVLRDGTRVAFYTYDPNGNRKTTELPTQTITADYDAQDRLERYGNNVYTYRDSGELLTKTVSGAQTTYDYDELGNLLSAVLPGNSVVAYEIDPLNRRVGRKFDGQVTHRWIYKDQLNPVAELDTNGNLVALFIYGTRRHVPDAMVKNDTRYLFVTDRVGSVRLVVNAETGAIVQRIDYDAWGNVTFDSSPGLQPFGFAGGLYDRDTKLMRFGARDYDPEVGRWTSKDPIQFSGGDGNLYAYVGNDPINDIDPRGLSPLVVCIPPPGAAICSAAAAAAARAAALLFAICLDAILDTALDEQERCRQVKHDAIQSCSWILNQPNKPGRTDRFNRCVNSILLAAGCLP